MELKEFVTEAILKISGGIEDAQRMCLVGEQEVSMTSGRGRNA
ncbi:hypothetical protein FHY16_000222 [Xanthomonas campestris]|nr:hypothetical protein [Xanthomonas euroxanthea]MBB3777501.1 hypothetical protein [Xanthomonas euroxanthea]